MTAWRLLRKTRRFFATLDVMIQVVWFRTYNNGELAKTMSYHIGGQIAQVDTMLRLIQDREIEISALLRDGISKVDNDDTRDR